VFAFDKVEYCHICKRYTWHEYWSVPGLEMKEGYVLCEICDHTVDLTDDAPLVTEKDVSVNGVPPKKHKRRA